MFWYCLYIIICPFKTFSFVIKIHYFNHIKWNVIKRKKMYLIIYHQKDLPSNVIYTIQNFSHSSTSLPKLAMLMSLLMQAYMYTASIRLETVYENRSCGSCSNPRHVQILGSVPFLLLEQKFGKGGAINYDTTGSREVNPAPSTVSNRWPVLF